MRAISRCPSRFEIDGSEPSWLPVTVNQVKESARMDTGDSSLDNEIEALIIAVSSLIERYAGLVIRRTDFIAYYDGFPVKMKIVKQPLVNVSSIEHLDDQDGSYEVVDSGLYQVRKNRTDFDIFAAENGWPWSFNGLRDLHGNGYIVDAVQVRFTAGYEQGGEGEEDNANVPADIQRAIIFAVVAFLISPGQCEAIELPNISRQMLSKYKSRGRWL